MALIHLILGGARSGKSSMAEKEAIERAKATRKSLVYIATAQAHDEEMAKRIRKHQQDRGADWTTLECSVALVDKLDELKRQSVVILVDCLTLWITNYLCQQGTMSWEQAKSELMVTLANWHDGSADLFLVSNEVGHGIVPMGELSRHFVDESGWRHQLVLAK